ncbi:MAG: PPC domain-containing protein [Planctomycetaceae bacterium]
MARKHCTTSAAAWLAISGLALAEFPEPRLTAIEPPGGMRGSTVEVTVSGSDLDDATGLTLSHPGITAKPVMTQPTEFDPESKPIPGKLAVTIAADVPSGLYDASVVCRYGVSSPRGFVVGRAPEFRKTGPIDSPDKAMAIPLEASVSSRLDANAADHYAVECNAGQRVHAELWARRIDSRITPVISVLDTEGRELRLAEGMVAEDPAIDFTPTKPGRHVIRVHDRFAGGGDGFFYRLGVSTGPVVVSIFPPAAKPGQPATFTVTGRGLGEGSQPMPNATDGLEQKPVQVSPGDVAFGVALRPAWRLLSPWDGAADLGTVRGGLLDAASQQPTVLEVDLPVVQEQEPNDDAAKPQSTARPAALAGRFHPKGDRDWFSFDAKAGEDVVLELFSRRLGGETDASILVESVAVDAEGKPQVKEIAFADDGPKEFQGLSVDQPTLDPMLRFKAPADGTYRVLVREQSVDSTADPAAGYVLEIREPKPGFDILALVARPDRADANKMLIGSTSLPVGGTVAIDLLVLRQDGFAGDVTVTAEDLPPGVTSVPVVIASKARRGVVVLQAADDAKPLEKSFRLVGRSKEGEVEIVRNAWPATLRWNVDNQQRQPNIVRRSDGLRVAVTVDAAPITVRPKESKAWETARGGKLSIPIDVVHRAGSKGPLSLVPVAYPPEMKLPAELKVPEVKIAEVKAPEGQPAGQPMPPQASSGEVAVDIDPKLPAGTYTVALQGVAKLSYARNPDAAARTKADAERVAVLAKERAAKVETAKQALAALEKQIADLQAGGGQPTAEMIAARDAAKNALAAAEASFKAAEEERVRREKTAADTATANAPKDIDVPVLMPPITLVVDESPVAMKTDPAGLKVEAGGAVDLGVELERKYGFAGPVSLEVQSPTPVAGLTIAPATVPPEAAKAALKITTAPGTPPGTHVLALKGKVSFFDREVAFEQKVSLVVSPKPQEPAKP